VLDLVYIALLAAGWPLYEHFVDWPRFQRWLRDEPARARTREYRATIVRQWLIVAAGAALLAWHGQPLSALGVQGPHGWRLWVSVAVVSSLGALYTQQPGRPGAVRVPGQSCGRPLEPLLPHTARELGWYLAVAVTAGVCEELVFRGYFAWALAPWVGWWGGVVLGAPVFGCCTHTRAAPASSAPPSSAWSWARSSPPRARC
jgi:membrane protease YdiL (CAAX protease family)